MTKNERRIIDISYKKGLTHISSCLSALPILEDIYKVKNPEDDVVLGNSHAALALYVVLEAEGKGEEMAEKFGTHAERSLTHGIGVSGGSLGQPETVAVGMALADRDRVVYLVTSDGACAEGSVWEALKIAADNQLENLRVSVVANGYSAYDKVELEYLERRLRSFYPILVHRTNLYDWPDWMQGVNGHYVKLDEIKYRELTK